MRCLSFTLALALWGVAPAADNVPLNAVTDQGRLVATVSGIPLTVELARIEWPSNPTQKAAAIAAMRSLAVGRASVDYDEAFGMSSDGFARVRVKTGSGDVAEQLLKRGLVTAQTGSDTTARLYALAQSQAQNAKVGIWASGSSTATSTSGDASASADEVVSELGSRYFYPPKHKAVASISSQRLTRYANAAAAIKAGKQAAPAEVALPTGNDRATADALYEQGRALMDKAMNSPPSAERDRLYAQAFPILGRSAEIYNTLAEAKPNDAALIECLRCANELRHAAMKYRRS